LTRTRAMRLELEHRADLVVEVPREKPKDLSNNEPTARELFDGRVRDAFTFWIANRWGMSASAVLLLPLAFGSAVLGWILIYTLLHLSIWYAAIASATGFVIIPRLYLQRQQSREETKFMNFFPDVIDMMVRMVRAGLTVMGAVRTVGNEAPSPLNKVFTNLADQVDIGIMFEDALVLMGERIGLPDFRFFVVAVSLQHATGGNIAASLEILSDIIRKRRAMRLKAQATTGEVRISAYVLGALPFVVIIGLLLLSPAYLAPLVTDPRGNAIIGAAAVLMFLGFATMRLMMRSATRF
jgi:tight adherence protein B